MEPKTIFRKSALERLSSPEQLDQLMQVTTPRGWLALGVIFLLVGMAILWGFIGRLPVKVSGQGILLSPEGVVNLVSQVEGRVEDIYFEVGDRIEPGQVVARIAQPGAGVNTPVIASVRGYILEIQASPDSLVARGSPILSLEAIGQEGSASLETIVYLTPAEGKRVKPGMAAQVSPSTVKREEFGYILGTVTWVGKFPATRAGMLRILNNEELLNLLYASGAPIEVHIDLQSDPKTDSGYAWSSGDGPREIQIDSGTLCQAWIKLSDEAPINLVFPSLPNK